MVFWTLFSLMSFFHSNYKKERKIYITIIKRRVWGEKLRNITTGKQTITTQHKYLLTVRNERYKNENKENKHIWQKDNWKKLAPMKLNTTSNWGDKKVKLFLQFIKRKKKQRMFCGFFLFYLLKKILKCMTWGAWEERKGEREEEEAGGGGGFGRDNKNTAHTIPFFILLLPSSSSYRFPHPLFPFFI